MMVKKITKALTLLLGVALIFLVGVKLIDWMKNSTALNISDVVVNGNRLLKTTDVLTLIPVKEGQNITSVDLEEIKYSIEKEPYVKSALVSRKFPSAIQIDLEERVPVAMISGTRSIYLVDREGTLLPVMKSMILKGFPVITGIKNFKEKVGEKINSPRVHEAIELFNFVKKVDTDLFQNLSEVHYNKQKGFLVYFNDGRFPVYFGFDNFYVNAQKLKAFFRRVREEKRFNRIRYVDLRFNEQVVAKFN